MCCASAKECLQKAKGDAVYVVQKHIPDPLLYTNGEKCHIKRLGLRKMCFINRAPLMDRYWGRASALKVLQPFDRP